MQSRERVASHSGKSREGPGRRFEERVRAGVKVAIGRMTKGRMAKHCGSAFVSVGLDVTTFRMHKGSPPTPPIFWQVNNCCVFSNLRSAMRCKPLKRQELTCKY